MAATPKDKVRVGPRSNNFAIFFLLYLFGRYTILNRFDALVRGGAIRGGESSTFKKVLEEIPGAIASYRPLRQIKLGFYYGI
mmetsp:Transcript_14281/g.21774  ORF Transcript_14281/g.21774 Transcript_14281/m.21774 type:complete len:82 (-) Transcript_14281:108-353(-)